MPELPEVEIITRALRDGGRGGASIVGHRITNIQVDDDVLLQDITRDALERRYLGAMIECVARRAKYILVQTTMGPLVFHLRMTGDLVVDETSDAIRSYQRLDIGLDERLHLRFTDPRRLGKMWGATPKETLWQGLGPEPLADEFSEAVLREKIGRTRQTIKMTLLDSRRVAGLGNIWADEALFLASIHPAKPAHELTPSEVHALWHGIREALRLGIARTAKSLAWVHRGKERGVPPGQIHLRDGAPCVRCQTRILRIRLGGRSTYLCPQCQPNPHR